MSSAQPPRQDQVQEHERATERFQVDLAGMVDLLSSNLYSGPQVYLRELLQNAVDALAARREREPEARGQVRVECVVEDGVPVLSVADTGTGLTGAQARDLLATIGRSSKRDPLLGGGRRDYIGQFGIGLLAAFMVAERIDVYSRSMDPAARPIHWQGRAEGTFTLATLSEEEAASCGLAEAGSVVRLRARRGCEHWLEEATVAALAREYAGLLPDDVRVVTTVMGRRESARITNEPLPWQREAASPASRGAQLARYCAEVFGFEPLASIDLSVPVAGLSGVAFVLPQAVTPGSGRHRVYTKRMLVGTRVERVLPEWAFLVRAVINSDALTPTASREDVRDDEVLCEVRAAVGEQVRQWLVTALNREDEVAEAIVRTHHLALRAVAVADEDMLDLVSRVLPYETTDGERTLAQAAHLTTDEAGRSVREIVYTSTTEAYGRVQAVARAQGMTVVNAGYVYDADLLAHLARRPGWRVRELEAGDVVRLLGLPPAWRLAEVGPVLARAEEIVGAGSGEPVSVVLRTFEPADLPAVVVVDAQARRRRALHEEAVAAADVWDGLLASLDAGVTEPALTLVLNDSSEVVRQLLAAHGHRVFEAALSSVFLSAVMLSGERAGSRAARSLGEGLGELIAAALAGGGPGGGA